MILLAVSGGPDSMYLLYKYRHKKIVVAHVNYHLRKSSNQDETVVKNFCEKYHIPLEILNVKTQPQKNLQNWARKIRYDFFIEVAKKYDINKLLTAHHMDDFLETALMQQKSKRTPKYFGIKEKNHLYGLTIKRPLLHKINKREILKFLTKNQIAFAIDESNEKLIYERNKIRKQLENTTSLEKYQYYRWFKISNKILTKKTKKIDALYKKWKQTKFDPLFLKIQKSFKKELVFELIHQNFDNINLSTSKIENLIAFIESKDNNKIFILGKNQTLKKTKSTLIFNND